MAILDGSKDHMDGDYEDPELHMVEAWPSIQILPARPIKESEYAGNIWCLKSGNARP